MPTKSKKRKGDQVEKKDVEQTRYLETKDTIIQSGSHPDINGNAEPTESTDAALLKEDDSAPTLAERLRMMMAQRGESLTAEQLESAGLEPTTTQDSTTHTPPIAPVQSLAQTLVQALHSSDSRLLESCLQHGERSIIQNTVRRLPSQLVVTLVEELVIRLGRKKGRKGEGMTVANPKRTKSLIEWLRQVLLVHVSYIVTIPSVVKTLATLNSSLQVRLDLQQTLLSLNGRLELMMAQFDLRREVSIQPQQIPKSKVKYQPTRYVEGEEDSDDDDEVLPDADVDSDVESESEEGSVEDIVLGGSSISDSEDEGDDMEIEAGDKKKKVKNGVNGFLELEAEESGSGSEVDEDDDDDDDDEEELDDGFIVYSDEEEDDSD